MKKGVLITFEGGEGVGKTTQIVRLRKRLQLGKGGIDVVALREPGGTVISEQIREVVLSSKNIGIAYTTEVLLFQAARAQIYREIVLPSLKAGKIVLMDRSRDSSVVYQGIVRQFGVDKIDYLNSLSTNDTIPDLTLLLDAPVEIGLGRRFATKDVDRLDMENSDFHEKVRNAYLDLVKENDHKRWVKVDATKTLEEVENDIYKKVMKILKK
jgi:dTMP kinase